MGRTPASFLLNQSSAEISSVHHRPPEATGVQEMIGGVPKGKTKSGQTADIPHSNPQVRKLEERTHRELAEPVDPKPLLYSRQLQAYTSIRALRVSRSVVNVQQACRTRSTHFGFLTHPFATRRIPSFPLFVLTSVSVQTSQLRGLPPLLNKGHLRSQH